MDLILDIFNYTLIAILIGVCGAWIFLLKSMLDSFRFTPYLDKFENTSKTNPKVSNNFYQLEMKKNFLENA